MAQLSVQQVINTGLVPSFAAATAGGDKIPPGDTTWLYVKNGGVASVTVTVDSVAPSSYGTDVDLVVAVAAGAERLIGPITAQRFAAVADGLATVTYSGVTSVTVGAFRV